MRLLLIEDHADLAASVRDFFAALGHAVTVCADGVSGLKTAQRETHDVILLDRMLPKLDGAELCRRLRKAGSRTPVLMLTALDGVDDKVAGFGAGADDYLPKPFAMAELRARIEALHRRAGAAAQTRALRVGDLHFNLDSLQALRAGRAVPLNPTTRKILELLMRQTHRVVLRSEVEKLLWGSEVPADDVLRVHMSALRSALDKPFARKLLHTVHGVGYRLAEHIEP